MRQNDLMGKEREKSLLKVGKIPYANLSPIFYALQMECDCSRYEFIEGVPSTVNRLLRSGGIDISPSSSIEYLRYKNQYNLIEGHSISSKGPAGSIFLLTRRPIEQLEGKAILVSSQSDTSVALLDIMLRKFYEIVCSLERTDGSADSMIEKADAFLVIGDEALKAAKKVTSNKLQVTSTAKYSSPVTRHPSLFYIYDLGELWYKNTGLPFVFALWIARKDCYAEKAELLHDFVHDLQKAKISALQNLDRIARELRPSLLKRYSLNITEEELVSYWNGISYDLTEEHKKGLELFRKYSEELGLL
jgi:chorismate dehydratase